MKNYIMIFYMLLILLTGATSCDTDEPIPTPPNSEQPVPPVNPNESDDNNESDESGNDDNNNQDDNNPMSKNLKISIGTTSFNATLDDNASVTAFKALLPMTVNMSELNRNEKYYYLPDNLPTASSSPGTIRNGDLMLYGSSCLVLFYKTFSTSYSYTRLGRVDHPSELAAALGSGSVSVTFELQ